MILGSDKQTVLVTRPHPQADDFAMRLAEAGFEPILSPLLQTQTLPEGLAMLDNLAKPDLVLITSRAVFRIAAYSLERLARQWPSIPIICSGEKTATAAKSFGFRTVLASSGHGSAGMLSIIQSHLAQERQTRIIYLTGSPRTPLLEEALQDQTYLDVIALYQNTPATEFSRAAKKAIEKGRLDAVTLFSTETAKTFVSVADTLPCFIKEQISDIPIICLSDRIADQIRRAGYHNSHVSTREKQESVLRKLVDQLKMG